MARRCRRRPKTARPRSCAKATVSFRVDACEGAHRRRARFVALVADMASKAPIRDHRRRERAHQLRDLGHRRKRPCLPNASPSRAAIIADHGARARLERHLHATFDGDDKAPGPVRLSRRNSASSGIARSRWAFAGDSGNDRACLQPSTRPSAVANVRTTFPRSSVPPRWIAKSTMGEASPRSHAPFFDVKVRLRTAHAQSTELLEQAKKQPLWQLQAVAFVVEARSGCELFDVDGTAASDLAGGVAVSSVGHAHPVLTAAIAEQEARCCHGRTIITTARTSGSRSSCASAPVSIARFLQLGRGGQRVAAQLARHHFHIRDKRATDHRVRQRVPWPHDGRALDDRHAEDREARRMGPVRTSRTAISTR